MQSPSTSAKIVLVLFLMVFGAANTIVLKLQNVQVINGTKFFHPYIQGCLMFIGQALCLLIYFGQRIRMNKQSQSSNVILRGLEQRTKKPPIPVKLIAIPGFLDFVGSNLAYIGLNMIPSSVWQLSKGGSIVTTAIFTKILLKKAFSKTKLLGCFLAIIGITLVGLGLVLFPQTPKLLTQSQTRDQVIGIGLVIVSLLFTGLQFCYQEKLFQKYEANIFQVVGFQGIFGLTFNVLLVLGLNFANCPWPGKCGGESTMESVSTYINQLGANSFLLGMCILEIFTIAISVSLGVTITKLISSLSRAIADVARTFLIWLFGFILTKLGVYHLENLRTGAIIMQMVGFVIVLAGTLIYHKPSSEEEEDQQQSLLKSGVASGISLQQQEMNRQSMI